MDIYLMQHGEAMAESADPARPLTGAGRTAVKHVAGRARAAGVSVDRCFHSGKLRAEQTARSVEVRSGLAPNDSVAPVATWLHGPAENGPVALVGHLPFLDRLASLLIAQDEAAQVISFRMGGLVKLVPKQTRTGFAVAWVLTPDIA